MSSLNGKVVVITGAASGLGEATARRFARDGARVILGDIRADAGAALAEELGGVFQPCDVTREADIAALVDRAVADHGRLDCMINNAGQLGAVGRIEAIEASAWRDTMAVLLDSVFYGMKHAARVMRPQGSGAILSTSSVAGVVALGPHVYTAAKHAVVGLTKSVASELAESGVRVNAVAPGNVPSRMTILAYGDEETMHKATAARNPLKRPIAASEIAGLFAYLASDDAINITGQVIKLDAGLVECRMDASYYGKPAAYFDAFGNRADRD